MTARSSIAYTARSVTVPSPCTTDGDATSFIDMDTEVGVTYRYDVRPVDEGVESEDCGVVEVTAIPVFPNAVAGAVAIGASLAGYVALRRRH